ncbi:hypothetical protein HUT18_00860 [Streptomyces sp. NA04227]|uniref:DedA family protein n=1 Tax=Streptomyces sp. NA04227 TaxID=2742136 RepID=UPI0015914C43|nr:hypothetical protein [Streptomyces sp. NA04227]QKW05121.1 hypothetical protein HUT18_00860 [Streptomyces sp. NA04227]
MQLPVSAEILLDARWITLLALAAVFLDSLLPVMPSGTLVIAASLALPQATLPLSLLLLAVATASLLGDLVVMLLARHGSEWTHARLARHPSWVRASDTLQCTLTTRMGRSAVAARFVPGGRTLLDITVGTSPAPMGPFVSWSAASGLLWAGYLITIGQLGSHWFATDWLSLAVSVAATAVIGSCVARVFRRRTGHPGTTTTAPDPRGATAHGAPAALEGDAPSASLPRRAAVHAGRLRYGSARRARQRSIREASSNCMNSKKSAVSASR